MVLFVWFCFWSKKNVKQLSSPQSKYSSLVVINLSCSVVYMLGAIGQSARSTDRAALLKDQIGPTAIGRSRNNRSIAQQPVDPATIGRSHNEHLCAIYGSCRNGFGRSTDSAGKVLRDQPIVQENFARSTDRAGLGLRDRPIVQEWFRAFDRSCR